MTPAESSLSVPLLTFCGDKMEDPAKYPHEQYQGNTIYFCCENCRQEFLESPSAFLKGHLEHH